MELTELKHRPGTSDEKAFDEVYVKKGYERRDFKIEEGEHWLDMGAHIGTFLIFALERGAFVESFEPDPEHFVYLKANTAKFVKANFRIYNFGLSDREGKFPFYRNTAKGNHWRNTFIRPWRNGTETICEVKNYRDFMKENVCIKMDIEGSEASVLEDLVASGLITKVKKLTVDWSFDMITRTERFLNVVAGIDEHMKRLAPTDRYLEKLGEHTEYPKSWFPPATKVTYVRKKEVAESHT